MIVQRRFYKKHIQSNNQHRFSKNQIANRNGCNVLEKGGSGTVMKKCILLISINGPIPNNQRLDVH